MLQLYQATPDTAADSLVGLGDVLYDFDGEMNANGLYQLGVNTVPGQVGSSGVIPFAPSTMSYFNNAQNALGYGLPQDMFNLSPLAQPTVNQVQATHSDVQTYGTVISNLQLALFWESVKLSNPQYGLNHRASHLVYASTRRRRAESRYRLLKVSSITPVEKAGIGLATAGVFVGGGAALIAGSGVTVSTIATASAVAVGVFTLGTAFVILGLGIATYYGITYLSAAAQADNFGYSIYLPSASSVAVNRICQPAPFV